MTTTINEPTQSNSFATFPVYYVNGLQISNDATTPHTLLDIGPGSILDSTQTYQIFTESNIVINSATIGLNGLDTGTLSDSTMYAVYLVADPVTLQATGAMISKSLTGPLMPFGYSAYALIGFVKVDGSGYFVKGYWTSDDSGNRQFFYDTLQTTAVSAGNATTFTAVNLIASVPNINNTPVWIDTLFTPAAASDYLSLQPANATGTYATIIGQVMSVGLNTKTFTLAQQTTISSVLSPAINYKVSSGSDSVAIDVAGYQYFI